MQKHVVQDPAHKLVKTVQQESNQSGSIKAQINSPQVYNLSSKSNKSMDQFSKIDQQISQNLLILENQHQQMTAQLNAQQINSTAMQFQENINLKYSDENNMIEKIFVNDQSKIDIMANIENVKKVVSDVKKLMDAYYLIKSAMNGRQANQNISDTLATAQLSLEQALRHQLLEIKQMQQVQETPMSQNAIFASTFSHVLLSQSLMMPPDLQKQALEMVQSIDHQIMMPIIVNQNLDKVVEFKRPNLKIKMQSVKNERYAESELEMDGQEKRDEGMIDEMKDEELEPINPPQSPGRTKKARGRKLKEEKEPKPPKQVKQRQPRVNKKKKNEKEQEVIPAETADVEMKVEDEPLLPDFDQQVHIKIEAPQRIHDEHIPELSAIDQDPESLNNKKLELDRAIQHIEEKKDNEKSETVKSIANSTILKTRESNKVENFEPPTPATVTTPQKIQGRPKKINRNKEFENSNISFKKLTESAKSKIIFQCEKVDRSKAKENVLDAINIDFESLAEEEQQIAQIITEELKVVKQPFSIETQLKQQKENNNVLNQHDVPIMKKSMMLTINLNSQAEEKIEVKHNNIVIEKQEIVQNELDHESIPYSRQAVMMENSESMYGFMSDQSYNNLKQQSKEQIIKKRIRKATIKQHMPKENVIEQSPEQQLNKRARKKQTPPTEAEQIGEADQIQEIVTPSKTVGAKRPRQKKPQKITKIHDESETIADQEGSILKTMKIDEVIESPKTHNFTPQVQTEGYKILIPKNPRNTTQRNISNLTEKLAASGISQLDIEQELHVNSGTLSQYNLVNCEPYQSFETQPYRIYFTFEVQILMYIHSYLSKNEIIGMLGGKCYETNELVKGTKETIKILIVSRIYPSESCIKIPAVRLKNCEISDQNQIQIQDQMDKDGVQKLAWYHSHPIFEVDPSVQDMQTHFQQQINFDRQGLPFFGVIIGPYSNKQSASDTLFNVFHLRDEKQTWMKAQQRVAKINYKEKGRSFHYKVIPNTKLKYSMYQHIKIMIKQSASHKHDKPDLDTEWAPSKRIKPKITYLHKLLNALQKICTDNLQLQKNFNLNNEVRSKLITQQDKETFDDQMIKGSPKESFLSFFEDQVSQRNNEKMPQKKIESAQQVYVEGEQNDQQVLNQNKVMFEQIQQNAKVSQQQQQTQQLLSGQNNILYSQIQYFSISDDKKILKFLQKIQLAVIKSFPELKQIPLVINEPTFDEQLQQNQAQE